MQSGDLIKILRYKKGYSQKNFAKKTGITANYLYLIENGKRKPTVSYIKKAAEILEIPANLLLWEEVDFSKFKDKKSKQIAKEIDDSLSKIKNLLADQILS